MRAGATLLDGDALAARMRVDLGARVQRLATRERGPCLATVTIGGDPATLSYIGRKHADCAALGIASRDIRLREDVSQVEALARIAALNADAGVTGFLVQFPLPAHLDLSIVSEAICPAKDIDGLHPLNLGRLVGGGGGLLPCTPAGILALLSAHGVPLAGRNVAILGRGAIVGRPLAMLLSRRGIDATVTLLHARSTVGDRTRAMRAADVVIAAVGTPGLVTADLVKPGAAVVGVGISYDDGAMVSDVAADVADVAGWVTPPHGSVGALTRAFLLRNLLDIAEAA